MIKLLHADQVHSGTSLMYALVLCIFMVTSTAYSQILNVGVVGLSHDHAHSIMNQFKRGEVNILGIAESDEKLVARFKERYQLPEGIFFKTTTEMLSRTKPQVVLAYNPIVEHLAVVEACAPNGISVMVEKPLATTVKDAERIAALANSTIFMCLPITRLLGTPAINR